MKRKITATLSVCLSLAAMMSGCNNEARLHELIEKNTADCPTEILPGFILERVRDDGQWITYRYIYIDSLYNPAALQRQYGAEAMKQTTLQSLAAAADMQEFLQEAVNCGRGIKYVYIGTPSADSCAIVIEPGEVSQALVQSSE